MKMLDCGSKIQQFDEPEPIFKKQLDDDSIPDPPAPVEKQETVKPDWMNKTLKKTEPAEKSATAQQAVAKTKEKFADLRKPKKRSHSSISEPITPTTATTPSTNSSNIFTDSTTDSFRARTKDKPIAIDIGSGVTKAGFASDEKPSFIMDTIIGIPKHESIMNQTKEVEEKLYIGDDAQNMRGALKLSYPIKRGVIQNWDHVEKLISHTLDAGLHLKNLEGHPVIITETVNNPKANREKMVTVMFETFQVPALYITNQAVLAMYAAGLTTGLVVDSGDGRTEIVPVYEGYSLSHAVNRLELGGADLTEHLMSLLKQAQEQAFKNTTAEFEITKSIKESLCYVANDYDKELTLYEGPQGKDMTKQYTLPDGKVINIGTERFKCAEPLFTPALIGKESDGIPGLCIKSVGACDIDVRASLASNVLLCGGSTLFPGFADRLTNDLQAQAPNSALKIKVSAPMNREYSSWIGASILSSLASFSEMWITEDEYHEHGANIVHKKCT